MLDQIFTVFTVFSLLLLVFGEGNFLRMIPLSGEGPTIAALAGSFVVALAVAQYIQLPLWVSLPFVGAVIWLYLR